MSNSSNSNGGIGVLGLLGVAFVVLKLTGYINWSWWYVTMPFCIGFPIITLVIFIIIVIRVWTESK
jgi:hypothetical protein